MEQHSTQTPAPVGEQKQVARESLAVPIAIVIAAGLIAGAIYMNGGTGNSGTAVKLPTSVTEEQEAVFRPVDKTDYIRGNPNAPILLVEYSDYDCRYCDQFHETLEKIMDEYGSSGKVAWVYRHMPLEQLHPNAPKIAVAAECVANEKGQEGFWKFTDRVFGEKTPDEFTDMSRIVEYALDAGATETTFEDCYTNNKTKERVDAAIAEGAAAGINGTPHTFVIVGDQKTSIRGAQQYATVKQAIVNILSQIEGTGGDTTTDS
jgi:protein-disulfide isomerase